MCVSPTDDAMAHSCPACNSLDLRIITGQTLELVGYRCHDCGHTFYEETSPGTTQQVLARWNGTAQVIGGLLRVAEGRTHRPVSSDDSPARVGAAPHGG